MQRLPPMEKTGKASTTITTAMAIAAPLPLARQRRKSVNERSRLLANRCDGANR
jgi:hypothetical protein